MSSASIRVRAILLNLFDLTLMASVLEIIPLGGIGEFGMNCMAVRYGDEMLILDAGMGFPEETAYGVDVSIPNFNFLDEYATTSPR